MNRINKSKHVQQCGLSFSGFLLSAFFLVLISVILLKMIPSYMQNIEIQTMFDKISNDPEMFRATPHDIRASFDRRAAIDDIKAIKAEDIDIENDSGKPVLSASYSVKVPLIANVSLSIDFNPHSANH